MSICPSDPITIYFWLPTYFRIFFCRATEKISDSMFQSPHPIQTDNFTIVSKEVVSNLLVITFSNAFIMVNGKCMLDIKIWVIFRSRLFVRYRWVFDDFFLERLQRLRLPPDAITLKKYYIPSLSVFVFSLSLSLPLSLVAFSLDLRNEKFLFFCDNFLLKHFSALSGHPMTCTFSSHFFFAQTRAKY